MGIILKKLSRDVNLISFLESFFEDLFRKSFFNLCTEKHLWSSGVFLHFSPKKNYSLTISLLLDGNLERRIRMVLKVHFSSFVWMIFRQNSLVPIFRRTDEIRKKTTRFVLIKRILC